MYCKHSCLLQNMFSLSPDFPFFAQFAVTLSFFVSLSDFLSLKSAVLRWSVIEEYWATILPDEEIWLWRKRSLETCSLLQWNYLVLLYVQLLCEFYAVSWLAGLSVLQGMVKICFLKWAMMSFALQTTFIWLVWLFAKQQTAVKPFWKTLNNIPSFPEENCLALSWLRRCNGVFSYVSFKLALCFRCFSYCKCIFIFVH